MINKKINTIVEQSFSKVVVLIFVVAIVVRLLFFQSVGILNEGDSPHYLGVSENIVRYGAVLETDRFTGELRPQTLRMPGYSIFAAVFYQIFGINDTALNALVIFQILLVSGISILVAFIGKRFFSNRVGILAAFFVAIDPWLIYSSLAILSEALFAPVYIISFLVGAIAVEKRNRKWALLWGVILALCTYIRPVAQHHFVIPLLLFAILPISFPHKFRLIAVSLIGFGLLVGGWVYRNNVLTGHPVLVTHQGMSMLWETTYLTRKSTNEDYLEDEELARARDLIAETPNIIANLMAENPDRERLNEGWVAFTNLSEELGYSEYEADVVMKKIAYENIFSNPFQYVLIGIKNIFTFFTRVQRAISFAVDLGWITSSVSEDLEAGRYLYPALNLGFRVVTFICFIPLLFWGILKSWFHFPKSRYFTLAFLLALFYHFVVVTLVIANDRYRIPFHGMMWLYIGYGIICIPSIKSVISRFQGLFYQNKTVLEGE